MPDWRRQKCDRSCPSSARRRSLQARASSGRSQGRKPRNGSRSSGNRAPRRNDLCKDHAGGSCSELSLEADMRRRELIGLLGGAVAAWPLSARAQQIDYPNRTVRIVIGFGAGGGTDTVARIFAQKLQETIGGTILIENKPGAAGRLAPETVAKSTPDGYTLLGAAAGAMTIGTAIWEKIPYNIFNDFVPISMVADYPMLVLVSNSHPAKNIA